MPFKPVPRLRSFDYRGLRRYFLTFCTRDRQPFFHQDETVNCVTDPLVRTAADHGFVVIAYCFMPDHLHLLVEGCDVNSSLPTFGRAFTQQSSFHCKRQLGRALWQRSYYEHVLRDEESTVGVARYILENPLRAGLAARVEEYPYVGSMTLSIRELLDSVSDDR